MWELMFRSAACALAPTSDRQGETKIEVRRSAKEKLRGGVARASAVVGM